MKKFIFILSLLFLFASSASAAIYKWVDEKGAVNFTDDYSKVPPDYLNKVEKVNIAKASPAAPSKSLSGKTAVGPKSEETMQPPSIGQTLIREGDFAVKLTEALKVGQAKSEPEAENMLASVGITPKNGWIADYPVTPDIIGELQNAISAAADSGKLAMKKDQAMKALRDLTAQQGLPIRAGDETQYAGAEQPPPEVAPPQNYPEYYEPSEINNYYNDQGPPIVTYYPPPWDYSYLYAWVPYPFWFSGFWFPGFFCLHDFHRGFFVNGHREFISNHFWDSGRRRFGAIDPARRRMGNTMANVSHSARGFSSPSARNGASSILRRGSEHTALNRPMRVTSGNRGRSGPSNFRGGVSAARPPTGYRPPSTGPSHSGRTSFARPTSGTSSIHPGTGTGRSFSLPSRSGISGLHSGGSGGRGFSGGGGRGSSGGGGRSRR